MPRLRRALAFHYPCDPQEEIILFIVCSSAGVRRHRRPRMRFSLLVAVRCMVWTPLDFVSPEIFLRERSSVGSLCHVA